MLPLIDLVYIVYCQLFISLVLLFVSFIFNPSTPQQLSKQKQNKTKQSSLCVTNGSSSCSSVATRTTKKLNSFDEHLSMFYIMAFKRNYQHLQQADAYLKLLRKKFMIFFLFKILYQDCFEEMSAEPSFSSIPHIPEGCPVARNMMGKMKSSMLRKITEAKNNFQQKMIDSMKQSVKSIQFPEAKQSKIDPSVWTVISGSYTEEAVLDPPRIMTESSCEDFTVQPQEAYFGEWVLAQDKETRFEKAVDMSQHYHRVFQKKIKFFKSSKFDGDSFKVQEKQVISRIYAEIGDPNEKNVSFDRIQDFFQQCPLFYRIYNIHPDSLRDVLSDAAHHHEAKLTQQEFMNLFLLNNRTAFEYQNYNIDKSFRKCVLDEETWADLKEIFDLFDTFGNQTIQLKKMLKKLKINIQYKNFLNKEAIYFPGIRRHYTLKKVLFEIQRKLKVGEDYFQWSEIKSMIENFSHVKNPSIDVIEKEVISHGSITSQSNSYLIKSQLLEHLKQIFEHCPKYCNHFVKVSHFVMEVNDAEKSKHYLSEIVRNEPTVVTLKQSLSELMSHTYKYMDLDEIIQSFSIKGLDRELQKHEQNVMAFEVSSQSSDEQFTQLKKLKQKARRSIQNLPKKHHRADSKDVTRVQEFNLSKKSKVTIRQQKVNQMVKQAKDKQNRQLKNKFKANPIPASINNQKYEEYRSTMNKNKEVILSKLNKTKQQDQLILQYLQANTKLFQKPKQVKVDESQQFVFKAEPLPWFIHANLLEQINQEKQKKKKEHRNASKFKYLREWKNLPGFLMQTTSSNPTPIISQTQSEQVLIQNVQEKSQMTNATKKVKEIPNFQLLHRQFLEELEAKKQHIKPTVVEQFHLSSPRVKQNTPPMDAAIKSPQKAFKKIPISSNNFIGSTLKFESLVKANLQKKVLQELHKQEVIDQEKQKQRHRQMFAKMVRKELKKESKLKKKTKKGKKQRPASNEDRNKREIANMYSRVFSRPFLFQATTSRQKQQLFQEKARPVQMTEKYAKKSNKYIETLDPQQLIQSDHLQYREEGEVSVISQKSI